MRNCEGANDTEPSSIGSDNGRALQSGAGSGAQPGWFNNAANVAGATYN
ncbi:hypothetical protein LD112_11500 [Pantoea agglomerans]|nr:hypothetical protein [Pantoea agglomerans]